MMEISRQARKRRVIWNNKGKTGGTGFGREAKGTADRGLSEITKGNWCMVCDGTVGDLQCQRRPMAMG